MAAEDRLCQYQFSIARKKLISRTDEVDIAVEIRSRIE
jgi:hypothetical protein